MESFIEHNEVEIDLVELRAAAVQVVGALLHGRLFPSGARGVVGLQHVIGGRWTWVAGARTRADAVLIAERNGWLLD